MNTAVKHTPSADAMPNKRPTIVAPNLEGVTDEQISKELKD